MLAKLSKHHIWRRVIHRYAPALIALLLPAVVFAIGASAEASHTLPGAAPTTQAMGGPGAPQRLMGGLSGTRRTTAGAQQTSAPATPPPCGLAWRAVPSPSLGTSDNYLSGVLALSPSDVWVAGHYNNDILAGRTLVAHWNGSAWSVVDSPSPGYTRNYLGPMAALSANDIWAVGSYGNNGDPIPRQVVHRALGWQHVERRAQSQY